MTLRFSIGQEVPASGRVKIDILSVNVGGRLESVESPSDPKADAVLNVDYRLHGDSNKELEWLGSPKPSYLTLRVAIEPTRPSRFQEFGPSTMVLVGVALSSILTYCQTTRNSDITSSERIQADINTVTASIRERGTCMTADTGLDCIRHEIRRMATAEEQLSSLRVFRTETRIADAERNRLKLRFIEVNMCDSGYSSIDCFRGISDVAISWMQKNCPDFHVECVHKIINSLSLQEIEARLRSATRLRRERGNLCAAPG